MNTIHELDCVALTCDLPEHGLMAGDVGTAVLVHGEGVAYEVEFVGYDGHTVALLTLEREQLRTLATREIPHARELAHLFLLTTASNEEIPHARELAVA